MFPPPWRDEARKSRRPGHVDCQADFRDLRPSSPPRLWPKHHRRNGHDADPPGGTFTAFISAGPATGPLEMKARGGGCSHAVGAGNRLSQTTPGARKSRKKLAKRKRTSSKRRSPGKERGQRLNSLLGDDEVSATSTIAPSLFFFRFFSSLPSPRQPGGGVPGLRDSWRNKLLLQALRETGEEMKRRRETHREVRARHAAEEGAATSVNSASMVAALQAGGEGRWKPALSRRTRAYLAQSGQVLPIAERGSSHGAPVAGRNGGGKTATVSMSGAPGSRGRRARRDEAQPTGEGDCGSGGDCGGGTRRVSLTTSVEVTVVNGVSGGEEGVSFGDGGDAVAGIVEDKNGSHESEDPEGTMAEESNGMLPICTQSRCSTTSFIPALAVDEGAVRTARGTGGLRSAADSHVSAGFRDPLEIILSVCQGKQYDDSGAEVGASSIISGNEKRRPTASQLQQSIASAAVNGPADEDEEARDERRAASGQDTVLTVDGRKQDTPPAPFRGTFWDEEDDDSNLSGGTTCRQTFVGGDDRGSNNAFVRKASSVQESTVRKVSSIPWGEAEPGRPGGEVGHGPTVEPSFDAERDGHGSTAKRIEKAGGDSPLGIDGDNVAAELPASPSHGTKRSEDKDGPSVSELSDGGLGRKALSAHTKNEDNRRRFFQLYRRMARQVEIVGDTGALSEEGHTPRQEFIRKMLKMGRMPVPILLRDPTALQDLNLASKGLGDDHFSPPIVLAALLAPTKVLTRLPHINTLNVADNRLTDRSLCKLCALVVEMPGLKSLDLSSNKIDQAAVIIRRYLAHPDCSLQTLSLRSADVDDDECCDLMEAISRNHSLTRLDVSENKIGQNEMLNAVQPDVVTGGEGIAETLTGNVTLEELNLSWNNLRQESAAAIGRALSLNRGLISLNLAHNAFNNLPSQEVGDSLRRNEVLQSLDLSYNGLTPASIVVIASACKANTSLTRLTLSGNRLGRQGSASLLSAIRKRTSAGQGRKARCPLLLGIQGCDCDSDSPSLFDVDEPSGEYKLDMSLPYSRMVVSEILALSESKKGHEIEGIWFAKDMDSLDKLERRELVKTNREASLAASRLKRASPCTKAIAEVGRLTVLRSRMVQEAHGGVNSRTSGRSNATDVILNGYERSRVKEQVMKLLEAVGLRPSRATMDNALDEMDWAGITSENDVFFAVFRAAFRVFDKDRSGSLEVDELLELFKGLGSEMDEQRCRSLVSVYDLDRSGALETEEFVTWMMLEHVREPMGQKGTLMETPKAMPWLVPREGAYVISFRASRFPGDIAQVESAEGLAAMVENIRHMNTATERLRMFENAAMHTDMLLTANQAEVMASLVERDQDRVLTAEKLLPQVVNSNERSQFLKSFLGVGERLRLAVRMKGLYRAIMGNPSGFYTLDLGSTQGRMAAIKLGEIANAERCTAVTRGAHDTSQKGNRMMFRNEVMDTVPQNLTVDWFVKLPRRGVIRMDVVSMARPRLSVRPLSDARFGSLKSLLGVDGEMQEIKEAYEILEYQRAPKKPGVKKRQQGTALASAESPPDDKGEQTSSPPANEDGNKSSVDNTHSARTVDTTPVESKSTETSSSTTADPSPKKIGSTAVGRTHRDLAAVASWVEPPYHYDAASIFRAKGHHSKDVVPDFEIPDCIIGCHAIEHWQQFLASSHFLLDYVEAERRSIAASH
ncbi:unnamed protein product, partial [Scytosiphon promiscuus]